jgi:hypothetical protein
MESFYQVNAGPYDRNKEILLYADHTQEDEYYNGGSLSYGSGGAMTQSVADQDAIKELFPNTYGMPIVKFEAGAVKSYPTVNVGVILSGGQAPGGHNVIAGLFDGLKKLNPNNKLYGFLGGPSGLIDHKYVELTAEIVDEYRNTGGFDMIGSGRTKLETTDQFEKGLKIIRELGIKAFCTVSGNPFFTKAPMFLLISRSVSPNSLHNLSIARRNNAQAALGDLL